jgi:CBS domain-containing protein
MPKPKPVVVEDIMTRQVPSLSPADSLFRVEEAMTRFALSHVPVLEGSRIVGLVTSRDLARAAASSRDQRSTEQTRTLQKSCTVADIMTKSMLTVGPQTPLAEAATLMRDQKLGCLPVTIHGDEFVGMVTTNNLLSLVVDFLSEQ